MILFKRCPASAGLCLLLVLGWLPSACGQEPVLFAFSGEGGMGVSNLEADCWLRVEWASSLSGSWQRTWQDLADVETGTNATVWLEVPMFYRVVSSPAGPPPGMVLVDGGPFLMGNVDTNESNEWWYAREVPQHTADVSPYYIERYEVSNERMRQVMQWANDQGLLNTSPAGVTNAVGEPHELLNLDDPSSALSFTNGAFSVAAGRENFPCVMVTWYGAMAYCSYRNDAEGLVNGIDLSDWSCDFEADGYRLPTEAEWEKAARGGLAAHHFPWPGSGGSWSNHIDGAKANYHLSGDPYDQGSTPLAYYNGSHSPAGPDMANGHGIYDMAGNVYEWCYDRYSGAWYSHPNALLKDPAGPPTGSVRVLRGGAWYRTAEYLRCSFRHFSDPDFSYYAFGFRCARSARP